MVVPGEVSRRPGPGVLYCRSGADERLAIAAGPG